MAPPQMRHLAAAIDLTKVLLHNAGAQKRGPLGDDEQKLLATAKAQYQKALFDRYPRHLDKGEHYYAYLTDQFVETVSGVMKSGPNSPPRP